MGGDILDDLRLGAPNWEDHKRAAEEIEKLRDLVVLCSDGTRPFAATDGQWARIQSLKLQAEKKAREE